MKPVIFGAMLMVEMIHAAEVTDAFLSKIAWVESRHNPAAINKEDGAYGLYQIRQPYLQDANRILGTDYSLEDMLSPTIATEVVRAYLGYWGAKFTQKHGREPTDEELARIHNGGPRGAEKDCTLDYADRYRNAPLWEDTCFLVSWSA